MTYRALVKGTYADGRTTQYPVSFKAANAEAAENAAKLRFCQVHAQNNTMERMTFGHTKVIEITEVAS